MQVRPLNTVKQVQTSQTEGDIWATLAFKALDSTGKGFLTRSEILEMISDQGVMQHHSLDHLFKGKKFMESSSISN